MATLAQLSADRRARIDAAFASRLPSHPPFRHAPPSAGYQYLIYGGASAPLEFTTLIRRPRLAWARANEMALHSTRTHVCIRDPLGRVVFNGPKLDATGRPVGAALDDDLADDAAFLASASGATIPPIGEAA